MALAPDKALSLWTYYLGVLVLMVVLMKNY